MSTITTKSDESKSWQKGFLKIWPAIEKYARIAFRDMDVEAKEDALAEVVANALCAYKRLYDRGELQRAVPTALAKYAIAQYRAGRRVGTSQCSVDVYSPRAKKDRGYSVRSLGAPGEQRGGWMESLIDNRHTPVPDQAAFRIDFPRWLNSQSLRDRQVAKRLSLGYSTGEVARTFRISPARVSQLRRELADSWYAFIGPKQPVCEESK